MRGSHGVCIQLLQVKADLLLLRGGLSEPPNPPGNSHELASKLSLSAVY